MRFAVPLIAVLIVFFVFFRVSWLRRPEWRSRDKFIFFTVVILTILFTGVLAYLYTASHAARAR
jgi:hypothetical protein